jgi:BirA family biotin operon repressor/biotin-[acetyl-CoA-carboxylase] ligase
MSSYLRKNKIGQKVIRLDTVDSTNDYLMELASRGASHGTVVIADAQHKGKGRLDRKWFSPPGKNIYMSILLRPSLRPEDFSLLTVMSTAACVLAINKLTGIEAWIKWPNDIVVSGRKLGGILLESRLRSGGIAHAVVGIGINVNSRQEDFPEDLRDIATSVFHEIGRNTKRTILIEAILNNIDSELMLLMEKGPSLLLEKYKRMSAILGKRVVVDESKSSFEGIALDIDERGHLLVKTDTGRVKTISAGDVTVIRSL